MVGSAVRSPRRRLAERARDAARATLADRLRELRPWNGNVDELVDLLVPEIERWRLAIAETQRSGNAT
jgi:hypothetical protein